MAGLEGDPDKALAKVKGQWVTLITRFRAEEGPPQYVLDCDEKGSSGIFALVCANMRTGPQRMAAWASYCQKVIEQYSKVRDLALTLASNEILADSDDSVTMTEARETV